MKKKDRENEYRGIAALIIIVIVAIMLVYYYSHRSPISNKNSSIPIEAPNPPTDTTSKTQ